MFPNHRIRSAESPHAHFASEHFPSLHHAVHGKYIIGVGTVEAEGFDVVEDQVALSCLVELEFDDLGPVLAGPPLCDFGDGFDRHAAFLLLNGEVLVRGGADHEFHFRVEFGL